MINNYARYCLAGFAVILAIGLVFSVSPDHTLGDFGVYYTAGKNYLAKAPMYIPSNGVEEFKYSPFFALVFSAFIALPQTSALYIWIIINILLLYSIFYFLHRLKLISFASGKGLVIIFLLLALTGRYIFASIKIGQVNVLLIFLLVLTMYFEVKKKYFWAAVFLAFSLMVKLFPLLFLVYFVLRRKFKIAGYTILLAAIFLLLPAIYSGFGQNLKYIQEWAALLKSTPATMYYAVKNYSLLAFFSWFFIVRHENMFILNYRYITKGLTPQVYYAWAISCFVLFVLFFYDSFFRKHKDQESVYLDYAGLFVCCLLFNPLAYLNLLVLLVVPYFFILRYLFFSGSGKIWITVIGTLTVISFILSMAYNKVFFADIEQFYLFLKYRLPMWMLILVYLNLWLIKLSLKLKDKKQAVSL